MDRSLLTRAEEVALGKAIEAAAVARKKLAAGRMTAEKAAPILAAGSNAREILIARNVGLVKKQARHYEGQGVERDDLIQEGYLGLIRAVDKYDWRRGTKFSTVAAWWIRQALMRAASFQGQEIRVPYHIYHLRWTLAQIQLKLEQELGRRPTLKEVASKAGCSVKAAREALLSYRNPVSLDEPLPNDDERDFGDMLTDDGPGTEELAMREVEAAEVRKALAGLTDYPGDRAVIEKVFGIDGEPLADVDVARQMGVSRSRVQQRKARGLQTLEHAMEGTKSKRTRGRT